MQDEIDRVFIDSMERIRRGDSAEECVSRYPQFSEELTPLLQAATGPTPNMPAMADSGVRKIVMAEWDRAFPLRRPWTGFVQLFPRWATVAVAVSLFLFVSGAGVVSASQGSLPGETLYPVKQLREEAQLWLAQSPEAKVVGYTRLVRERVIEIEALAETNAVGPARVAVRRLEGHIADATEAQQRVVAEDASMELDIVASLLNTLEEAIVRQQSVELLLSEAIGGFDVKTYPCTHFALQAIQSGTARVRGALQSVLAEGSDLPIAESSSCGASE